MKNSSLPPPPPRIDLRPLLKSLRAAFHDLDDVLLIVSGVDAAGSKMQFVLEVPAAEDLLAIAQDRNIGVVGGKNELRFVLALQQGFHYLLVDGLAIQIVLRLVNDDEVIVAHG